MKKRVVILSAFLSPFRSGAEACAEEVALRLSDRFDITIITAKLRNDLPRYDLLQGKVPVIRVGFGIGLDKWLYPFLAPFAARKLKPELLHAVLETFAGVALLFTRWTTPKAKRILTLQTTNRNFLRGHILRSPDRVTAISAVLQKQATEYGRKDVTVIPNGIPYDDIRRACEGTQKIPSRILFVGRLEKMKGVDTLLRTFSRLPHSDERNSPTLHIIGSGSQRHLLERLAHDLRLTDRVMFLGYLTGNNLYREYAEAEIFCGLSRSEALGNVFLEAQAAGCAVVGTDVGGIPEIVQDGVTGILVEAQHLELAADVLATLLKDETFRTSLANAGVERAKGYDWNAIAEQYEQVYLSL